MSAAALKVVPDPHREALRAAIERVSELKAALCENEAAWPAFDFGQSAAADAEVERLEVALAKARVAQKAKLKAELKAAQERLDLIRESRAELESDAARLRERLVYSEGNVKHRRAELLQNSPAVLALLDEYKRKQIELLALGANLNCLRAADGLPRGRENFFATRDDETPYADPRWEAAIAALATDADAPLPE